MYPNLMVALILAHVLTASGTASAAEAAANTAVPVPALIERLGDKNFRVRQSAGAQLEQRGEEALPALRIAAGNHGDEEVSQRAKALIERIERTTLLAPKRVTLRYKDRAVEEVIRELAKQTGYKLQYQGGNGRRISLEIENGTYWDAMNKICRDGHITLGFDDLQGIVYLYQQDTISPYTCQCGAFQLVAQNFSYNRYVNLANLPRNGVDPNQQNDNNLNFSFLVQAEPKIPLLSVSPPRLVKAEDENGLSLLPRHQENEQQFNVQYYNGNGFWRNSQHSTAVAMAKPSKDATTARLVRGKLHLTVLAATKPDVVIEKLTVGKKKWSGSGRTASIEIEEITEQNKIWAVTMTIKRVVHNGQAQDFNWINSVPQKLELIDSRNQKFASQGVVNFINNSVESVHATYQFSGQGFNELGKDCKLVLNDWVTMSHELDFEFRDLPLP